MMIKFLGCVLVFICSVKIGSSLCNKTRKRVLALRSFKEMFEIFKIKFEYEYITIPRLMDEMKNGKNQIICDFSKNCSENLKRRMNLKESWDKACRDVSKVYFLNQDDLMIIMGFSQNFGETALSGQITQIESYISRFNKIISESEKEQIQKNKVTMTCTTFAGLILILVFI